jgi:hypothetical protein
MRLRWSKEDARIFHLYSVGLLGKSYPKAKKGIRECFSGLGTLQLDPLPIMGRSHDLVIQARVDGTHPNEALDLIHKERLGFEYWDKVYCAIPLEHYPLARGRMESGGDAWYRTREELLSKKAPDALEVIYKAVKKSGPLSSVELNELGLGQEEYRGWKANTAANAALDILWNQGRLAVSHRLNNRKYYDITERVIPKDYLSLEKHTPDEMKKNWLLKRVRDVGLLPLKGDQEVWASVRTARNETFIKKLIKKQELAWIEIEGVRSPCLAPSNAEDLLEQAKSAKPDGKAKFIAPLDPLVWSRKLVAQLWDFDYIWEVYKPQRQRKWGYYVLPVIVGDRFVARFDGKYDQKKGKLTVASYHEELGGLPYTDSAVERSFERFLVYLGGEKIKFPAKKKR